MRVLKNRAVTDLLIVIAVVAAAVVLSYAIGDYDWMRRLVTHLEFLRLDKTIPIVLAACAAITWFAYRRKRDAFKTLVEGSRSNQPTPYSWEMLKLLYEYAPDAFYIYDLKGRFLDGNKAAERIVGYRKDELAGKSFLSLNLISPYQVPKAAESLMRSAMGKETGPSEYLVTRKNGDKVIIEVKTYPLRFAEETLVLGIARNITEHKMIESELAASRESFYRIVEQSSDGIVVVDDSGVIQFLNKSAKKYLQERGDDLTGQKLSALFNVDLQGEVSITRQNGEAGIAKLCAMETDWRGEAASLVVLSDVTDHKRAENELMSTQQMLFQAEKMSAMGQMASGLAHEVKNPLGIIVQGVDYMRSNISPDAKQQHDVMMRIKRAITRADMTVRRLLDFARQTPVSRQPHNINEIVMMAHENVSEQYSFDKIESLFEFSKCSPPVLVDAHQIEEVFVNIFTNAIKAMEGEGRLTIRIRTIDFDDVGGFVGRRSTDSFKPGESAILCEVVDTGKGISPDIIERIFDPFFTTNSPGEGTGLGLAIARSLIELNGGRIWAASEEGKGASFMMFLPTVEV